MSAPSRIWVAKFSIAYASVPADAFAGNHGLGAGDLVVVIATDATHAWLLGPGGKQDKVW